MQPWSAGLPSMTQTMGYEKEIIPELSHRNVSCRQPPSSLTAVPSCRRNIAGIPEWLFPEASPVPALPSGRAHNKRGTHVGRGGARQPRPDRDTAPAAS